MSVGRVLDTCDNRMWLQDHDLTCFDNRPVIRSGPPPRHCLATIVFSSSSLVAQYNRSITLHRWLLLLYWTICHHFDFLLLGYIYARLVRCVVITYFGSLRVILYYRNILYGYIIYYFSDYLFILSKYFDTYVFTTNISFNIYILLSVTTFKHIRNIN